MYSFDCGWIISHRVICYSCMIPVFAMHAFRESENYHSLHAHMITTKSSTHEGGDLESWRRACGCLKTSEKLRRIINSFPSPPPPTPKESRIFNNPVNTISYFIKRDHTMTRHSMLKSLFGM